MKYLLLIIAMISINSYGYDLNDYNHDQQERRMNEMMQQSLQNQHTQMRMEEARELSESWELAHR